MAIATGLTNRMGDSSLFPQVPVAERNRGNVDNHENVRNEGDHYGMESFAGEERQGLVQKNLLSGLSIGSSRTLRLEETPAYRQSSPQTQIRLQQISQHFASEPLDQQAFLQILSSPVWNHGDAAARAQMLELCERSPTGAMDGVGPKGVRPAHPMVALAQLAQRELNGRPVLFDQAYGGATLLATLSGARLDPEICRRSGANESQILATMLLEISEPGRIDQGRMNTCAAASFQIQLVRANPAEYARLTTELLTGGEATLRNGDKLRLPPNTIVPQSFDTRYTSERCFQSALMQYARPEAEYCINAAYTPGLRATRSDPRGLTDYFREPSTGLASIGMNIPAACRISAALFGGSYEEAWHYTVGGEVTPDLASQLNHRFDRAVQNLIARHPDGSVAASGPLLVFRNWRGQGEHFVALTRLDPEGRTPRMVYLQNPFRMNLDGSLPRAGDPVEGGPQGMVWDDPRRGLVRMTYAALMAVNDFALIGPRPESRPIP
jgi:hypothetical protein